MLRRVMMFSPRFSNTYSFRLFALTLLVAATLALAPASAPVFAAPSANATTTAASIVQPPFSWDKAKQGAFVMALVRDNRGRLFVGTEDFGLWMRDEKGTWHNFNSRNSGLADDSVYALAIDKKGRVWAGTVHNGVSVFDGVKTWRNFHVLNGPLGERVFHIAVCPTDGDVWIATNAGLSRYISSKGQWRHTTRADGLPSDQISSLAFDSKGTLFVATQCDGLAISFRKDDYAKWTRVVAPGEIGTEPVGSGLPSNDLNDVSIAQDGTIYVASNLGVAWSADKGATWKHVRGSDYADKVAHRFVGAPKNWTAKSAVLSEDYTTCLARDASDRLWIGHRQRAYEVFKAPFDDKSNRVLDGADIKLDAASAGVGSYVTAILPMPNQSPLVARYGMGLTQAPPAFAPTAFAPQNAETPIASTPNLTSLKAKTPVATKLFALSSAPSFPAFDTAPSASQLRAMMARVQQGNGDFAVGGAAFLDEDWRTLGDWTGRYGRSSTILCSMGSPFDHIFIRNTDYDQINGQLGYNRTSNDRLRHYLSQRKNDDARVLYNPMLGYRREAEWDDHGETYPMSQDGPNLWISVGVPEGMHKLSLYFFNKDGHDDANRLRDYNVEIRAVKETLPPWPSALPGKTTDAGYAQAFEKMFVDYWDKRYALCQRAEKQPVLAQTRVVNFWGGVYKSFALRGPAKYWIKIDKNASFNTILQAVFLQPLGGDWTNDPPMTGLGNVRDNPPDPDAPPAPDPFLLDKILAAQKAKSSTRNPTIPTATSAAAMNVAATNAATVEAARELWKALDASYARSGNEAWQWRGRVMAYRAATKANAPDALLENWRWKMATWTPQDRRNWRTTMARAHWSLLNFHPELKNADF